MKGAKTRRRVLRELRNAGDHLSGEKLAERLGISRTSIWKHVQSLKEEGYRIESTRGKGHKLVGSPDKLLPSELLPLDVDVVGRKIIHFEEVGSTNFFLKGRSEEEEGLVVIAERQTEGRGRMGRKWESPKGGIWMSVLLKPTIPPERAPLLTMISSLAVSESLEEIGIEGMIKWPNDVLVRGRKVCGILTEVDAEMDVLSYAIIGIGINANFDREELPFERVTTVKTELGEEIDRKSLVRTLIERLDKWYQVFRRELYGRILDAWRTRSYTLGREVRVRRVSGEIYTGTAIDLSEDGGLVVRNKNGSERVFRSGDVTLSPRP